MQKLDLLVDRNGESHQRIGLGVTQSDMFGFGGNRIGVHNSGSELSTGCFDNQLRSAAACPIADANIGSAFEAVG